MSAAETIQRRFNKGCVDYDLLADGDRILVGLSGGKDSLMLVRLLAARSRIFRPNIEVEAAHIVMDNIPYESDVKYLEDFCRDCGVTLHVLHTCFDESTDSRKTRCFLCAWHRRKTLFSFAVELGFNKVALGHHNDDILTTFLMNLTFDGSPHSMPPKLPLTHYSLPHLSQPHYPLTLIRPLCLVREADILEVAETEGFHKQKVRCPYEETTRRTAMAEVFHHLESLNAEARYSLWTAMMKASPSAE